MKDYLVKTLADQGQFRVYAVDATNTVAEAQKRHDTWSSSIEALGRSLIATMLLSTSMMKNDEILTTRLMGNGPVKGIVVDGDAKGNVKGYVQEPHINLPLTKDGKVNTAKAVGNQGILAVTKDQGMKQPFTGKVPLVSGTIAEDYAYYLTKSEQIPSAVGLSVVLDKNDKVTHAGGFMVQTLPNAKKDAIDDLIKNIKKMPSLDDLLSKGAKPEEIIDQIFSTGEAKLLQTMPVAFKCDCSKERFSHSLATLSKKELQSMIDQNNGAELTCQFCGDKYEFSKDDLEKIIASK